MAAGGRREVHPDVWRTEHVVRRGCDEPWEEQCGGAGILERIVGALMIDSVALTERRQPMGVGSLRVQGTGQPEGAQHALDPEVHPVASGGIGEELGIEVGIVCDRRESPQVSSQFEQRRAGGASGQQVSSTEPMDIGGADTAQRPPQPHQRGPFAEAICRSRPGLPWFETVGGDLHQTDLENPIVSARET